MEQRGVRPGPLAFKEDQGVGKGHPDPSSLLCPGGAVPIGQHQSAAATLETGATKTVNQSTQHAPDQLSVEVRQQLEQMHEVLQQQNMLLAVLAAGGLVFPVCLAPPWLGAPPLLGAPPVLPSVTPDKPPASTSLRSASDGRRLVDLLVSTRSSADAFGSKKLAAEHKHSANVMQTEQTVDRDQDQDQDPVSPSGIRETSQDAATKPNRRGVKIKMKDGRGLTQRHELPEPELSRTTNRRCFFREDGGISRMDRNNLKVSDQQQVQRRAVLNQQHPSRKPTSAAQSVAFKDKGAQLETFRDLTFWPERSREFVQRKTRTENQAQAEVVPPEQAFLNTPLLMQTVPPADSSAAEEKFHPLRRERCRNKSSEKSSLEGRENGLHPGEPERRMNPPPSDPTAAALREKRYEETEAKGQTDDGVKSLFKFTAACGRCDGWRPSLQLSRPVQTDKRPCVVHEPNFGQHVNISPNWWVNRVSPRARPNEEVVVGFKAVSHHMDRISSFNMESVASGCDETETCFHVCGCSKSRPGSDVGSNGSKGQRQASAAVCLCAPEELQVSTPPFPMHSTRRSSGSSEDNPPPQCHHFPKLPFPPPRLNLRDSHLDPSEDDCVSEAQEGWMFPGRLQQDPSLRVDAAQETSEITLLEPECDDDPADSLVAHTSAGLCWCRRRDEFRRGLSDREESQTLRGLRGSEVQALQLQAQHTHSDWSVVRRQLDELIRQTSELKSKLTPQCCPVANRCTAHPQAEPLVLDQCCLVSVAGRTERGISADLNSKTVTFSNGDIKHMLADGKAVYHYATSQITHTTYPTGLEVLHFPNKQIERRHPGGKREILFPDQTIKYLEPDGSQTSIFADGTTVHLSPSGEKIVDFPNGHREIHTSRYKRREDPDGTVKTIYADGRQETQYASGRVRVKQKDKLPCDTLN